ncbi:Atp-binding protein, partial [Globisporangium polare]
HPSLQLYLRAFSLKFDGLSKRESSRTSCGCHVPIGSFHTEFIWQGPPFALDVWFCLLDGGAANSSSNSSSETRYTGGILFGAQSDPVASKALAYYSKQFVVVGPDSSLYCSVITTGQKHQEIACNLELHRWYHLALTYSDQTQRVYLDGELRSSVEGSVQFEWRDMNYVQVGTGCVSARDKNLPVPGYCGWCPFNGLVDSFRMWARELSTDEIRILAGRGGGDGPEVVLREQPVYSLKRDCERYRLTSPTRAKCSSPRERVLVLV